MIDESNVLKKSKKARQKRRRTGRSRPHLTKEDTSILRKLEIVWNGRD